MVDLTENELLFHIVVLDGIAEKMYGVPLTEGGCIRAWVLRRRDGGRIWATYRFKRPDGIKSWYAIDPDGSVDPKSAELLRDSLMQTFLKLCDTFGFTHPNPVGCFTPPPGLDCAQTMEWMAQQDLIDLTTREFLDDARN